MTLPTHMPCHVCRTASTCIIVLSAICKGSEQHIPACPHAAISPCVEAPVADMASGLLAAGEQRLKMLVLQGPPIEDDEEDYDEEEPPLSEDIEDEEDVDDEAGPSAAAGSRGKPLCSDPCVSPQQRPTSRPGAGMAGVCAEVAEAGLAMSIAR